MTHADAGRKGGIATLNKYGRNQLIQWGTNGVPGGKKPGRPRSRTPNDRRQQQRLERNNNKEVKEFSGTGNLNLLRAGYKLRDRSSPPDETEQAGMVQATTREPALPERMQR